MPLWLALASLFAALALTGEIDAKKEVKSKNETRQPSSDGPLGRSSNTRGESRSSDSDVHRTRRVKKQKPKTGEETNAGPRDNGGNDSTVDIPSSPTGTGTDSDEPAVKADPKTEKETEAKTDAD